MARDDVLDRMAAHRLTHPIQHGARVRLPRTDRDQISLFAAEEPRRFAAI